jgi:hypothetical protein
MRSLSASRDDAASRERCWQWPTVCWVAHSLLVSIYSMLRDHVPYQDLGPAHFDHLHHLHAQRVERHYVQRLEARGFAVQLTPAS